MKGSKIEDFESYTIQVNNSIEKPTCANCSSGCLKIKNNDN